MASIHSLRLATQLITLWFLSQASTSYANTCAVLAKQAFKDATITTAKITAADGELPEFCKVVGIIQPAINFEARLPTQDWNGKFYMAGCGGFCGKVGSDTKRFLNAMNYGLRRNYAVSTMDSGHSGSWAADADWAHNNRQAEVDWGYRAVHETANITKQLIDTFYGNQPEKSYFAGCSTGGRMAAMEAWRYPEDFDGIISGAPALNYTKGTGIFMAWIVQHNTDSDGRQIIGSDDIPFITRQVNLACDLNDGVQDNLIENPLTCNFDPQALLCPQGQTKNCLTQKKITALKAFYQGPVNSKGEKLAGRGIPLGSEPFWDTWITGPMTAQLPSKPWIFGPHTKRGAMYEFNQNFLRYMAFEKDPGESMNSTDFDFDKHPPLLQHMANIYNADNPDLAKFKARGGKMLIWHGWGDALIPATQTIDYYNEIINENGSLAATQDFTRLFLMPGTDHCGILPGPGYVQESIDILTLLEDWVEKDEAPETLLLTKFDADGKQQWQRPACAYPALATYDGKGDNALAESYQCVK